MRIDRNSFQTLVRPKVLSHGWLCDLTGLLSSLDKWWQSRPHSQTYTNEFQRFQAQCCLLDPINKTKPVFVGEITHILLYVGGKTVLVKSTQEWDVVTASVKKQHVWAQPWIIAVGLTMYCSEVADTATRFESNNSSVWFYFPKDLLELVKLREFNSLKEGTLIQLNHNKQYAVVISVSMKRKQWINMCSWTNKNVCVLTPTGLKRLPPTTTFKTVYLAHIDRV